VILFYLNHCLNQFRPHRPKGTYLLHGPALIDATIYLNNGMPMEDVSKLLGHSSLKTTAIYGRFTQDRLQKSIDKIGKIF
jgi:integrase